MQESVLWKVPQPHMMPIYWLFRRMRSISRSVFLSAKNMKLWQKFTRTMIWNHKIPIHKQYLSELFRSIYSSGRKKWESKADKVTNKILKAQLRSGKSKSKFIILSNKSKWNKVWIQNHLWPQDSRRSKHQKPYKIVKSFLLISSWNLFKTSLNLGS